MTIFTRGGAKLVDKFLGRGGFECHGIASRNASRPASSLPATYILPSGDKIPTVALGASFPDASNNEVVGAVKAALNAGYRHIDGAWAYHNEVAVGQAIKESNVSREEVFITSKLWNSYHAPEDIEPILDETLSNLQTSYVDLYLIHWPVAFEKEPYSRGKIVVNKALTDDPYPTWKKLEELVDKGKIRNLGISNFNIRRYENLTSNPLKHRPGVNQVELNFFNPQPELVKWAKDNDVLLEAYSPMGSTDQVKASLRVPAIKAAAKALGVTPAQVLISWHVQRGTIVLPKSVHCDRIWENFQILRLPSDMFDNIETAAASHPPQRLSNPSKSWGLDFDIFE